MEKYSYCWTKIWHPLISQQNVNNIVVQPPIWTISIKKNEESYPMLEVLHPKINKHWNHNCQTAMFHQPASMFHPLKSSSSLVKSSSHLSPPKKNRPRSHVSMKRLFARNIHSSGNWEMMKAKFGFTWKISSDSETPQGRWDLESSGTWVGLGGWVPLDSHTLIGSMGGLVYLPIHGWLVFMVFMRRFKYTIHGCCWIIQGIWIAGKSKKYIQ